MTKIAVFASGSGSNLQALITAIAEQRLKATIQLVICDRPGAYCLTRANSAQLPTFAFNPRAYNNKAEYELIIKQQLEILEVEYLILAGYMRLIGPVLLGHYPRKIINIHPSLLPLFPGKDGIGQALKAGVKKTGVTIHYVDEGIDTGPVIAQAEVPITADETRESLAEKIHAVEHSLYPEVLQRIFSAKEEQKYAAGVN